MLQTQPNLVKAEVQAVGVTKQIQALLTEMDLVKEQVQAVQETKQLLKETCWHLWSGLERVSPIVTSDSPGEEGEPELQFCAHPVATQKLKCQQLWLFR